MPSWPLQLEGKVFDGVEVVPMSHVDMKDKILNPDPRVYRSVVCLYIHGFKSLWKFMFQHHCIWMCHGLLSTVVVFGFDSELLFDQYSRFGGCDLAPQHVF